MQTPYGGHPRDRLSPHLDEIVITGQGAGADRNRMLCVRRYARSTSLRPGGRHTRLTCKQEDGKDRDKPYVGIQQHVRQTADSGVYQKDRPGQDGTDSNVLSLLLVGYG